MKYPALDLSKIVTLPFPEEQYYKEETKKLQIALHHTASGKGVTGDYKHFLGDAIRVATCVIIDYDGVINQLFSSAHWGHHLGIKQSVFDDFGVKSMNNLKLNKLCIGVEIDSWGPLVYHDGAYRSWVGTAVPKEEVYAYTNGFKCIPNSVYFKSIGVVGKPAYFYQKYTCEQIESTAQLLEYWNEIYDIPLEYNSDIWGVSKRALKGDPGVFTHNSYRSDKQDVHPQNDLIQMLKSL